MLYLYLFKRSKFFPRLPKRFALVANTAALLVIPVIVVANEIVSFLGIHYRTHLLLELSYVSAQADFP